MYQTKIETNIYKRTKRNEGYLRWKKQLEALKIQDFGTVKKLAQEAQQVLQQKRNGNLTLPFVS